MRMLLQLCPPIVPTFHVLISCLLGCWLAQYRSTKTFLVNSETNCHHSLLVAGGILHPVHKLPYSAC